MNKSVMLTVFVILALLSVPAFADCKYKHSDGKDYDFTNGGAAELSTIDENEFTYSFVFCGGTPTNEDCAKVGGNACLTEDHSFKFAPARWTADNGPTISEKPEGGLTLDFRNGDPFPSGSSCHLLVDLDCSNDISMSKLAASGLESNMEVTIHYSISHPLACPVSGANPGLSGGAIFLIVFFSLLAGYFVIGAVVCKFVFKQSGIKIVPQHAFWCALPGLFVAGVKYIISCFTKKSIAASASSSDGYDSV